jgi:uncharacterized phiE125 gp8 family phage protein
MAAPVLAAAAQRRGSRTRAGSGAVPLANILLVSGTPVSWAIVQTAGTTGHWTLPADGTSPAPTSAGVTAQLNGGPYVFSVTATNAAAETSTAVTLTITIDVGEYTVSTGADVDSTSTGLRGLNGTGTFFAGKTIRIARGHTPALLNFRGFRGSALARVNVTSEDPANRTLARNVAFNGCYYLDIHDIDFYRERTATTDSCIQFTQSGSFPDGAYCRAYAFTVRGPAGVTNTNLVPVGVAITLGHHYEIYDFDMDWVKDGVLPNTTDDLRIGNGRIAHFAANAIFAGGGTCNRGHVHDVDTIAPVIDIEEPGDHRDALQIGATGATADWTGWLIERVTFDQADGNGLAQFMFVDDIANGSSPYRYRGAVHRNCIGRGALTQTFATQKPVEMVQEFNTSVRAVIADGQLHPGELSTPADPSANMSVSNATSVSRGNSFQDIRLLETDAAYPDFELTGSGYTKYDLYTDPDNANVKLAVIPVLDGPLKRPDGRYQGALLPDGSWNDGEVYTGGDPVSITAAQVEANGWVLRLTITGSLTSPNTNFGAYALDPSGTPRVTLTSSHPGYVKSGGQAVSGTMSRSLVATAPLRLPVNPASPTVKVLDETDLGGGSIQVRLALSEHIYATDTSLSLAVLAGWRSGLGAQSGISVTNNSTAAAPVPIMRWALAPYETTAGTFRVSLLVFSHHPVGFEPVAGVKFTATDGTTVKTVWDLTLETDNTYGDNLRCYSAEIDPSTATALTTGLLRVDAEVYPWLGSMRTTDPAGTKSMTNLRTDGFSVDAQSPWVIGYDPAGTRYGQQWVYIDNVNGTTTASASMVATSLAGAKAVAPASRPRDISTAQQAIYLQNRTLSAANGQASATRSMDGARFVLAPGTHVGGGATSVTSGINAVEIPARVIGDPDDSNPRVNCIYQTATQQMFGRGNRFRVQNITIEAGTNQVYGSGSWLIDNCTIRGKSGQEGNTTGMWSGSPAAGLWNLGITRSLMWRYGVSPTAGNPKVGLFRANEHSRAATSSLVAVKNRLIGNVEDGFVGSGALANGIWQIWPSPTLAGQVEDIIIAWNDMRYLRGRAVSFATLAAATAGTPNPSVRRNVFFGNVLERIGTDPSPFYSIGEDASITASYNIIEANTHVGDRANTFYSDPTVATIADTNTKLNQAFVNRVANNAYDWLPTKHDDFFDSTVASVRGTSDGYRPHMVEAWSMLFGVGHASNYDTARSNTGGFPLMFPGVGSVANPQSTPVSPSYTDDNSIAGPDGATATGGGNYLPLAGSPLLARVISANSDRDIANAPRSGAATAGAFEAAGTTSLAPDGGTVAWLGAAAAISGAASLAAATGVIAFAGLAGTLTATATVTPAAGNIVFIGSQGALSASPSVTLSPAAATVAWLGAAGALTAGAGLSPATGALPLLGAAATLTAGAELAATTGVLIYTANDSAFTIGADVSGIAPITLIEAKAYLRVDGSDDDALIIDLINTAAARIESITGLICRRRSVVSGYASFTPGGRQRIPLRRGPVAELTDMTYIAPDGTDQSLPLDQVDLRDFAGAPVLRPAFGVTLPATDGSDGSVQITFNAGYASNSEVPAALRTAARLLVAHWYRNRNEGADSVPAAVIDLLMPYRLQDIG